MEFEVILLPHNEVGYDDLNKYLENYQMVSLNRATGTGKSFILAKFIFKNRKKRILYLSPSYVINDQILEDHMAELGIDKSLIPYLDFQIYRNLLKMDMEELAAKYDIIILDEYHRCGAKKWGIQVNKLLKIIKEKYPNTKVIGTTATEVRYLDNDKNMNYILFDGVEASRLSLVDAILMGILPAPVYVITPIYMLKDLKKIEERINKYTFYNNQKIKYDKLLSVAKEKIENVIGNYKTYEEYLDKENGKYIVFSQTISEIHSNRQFIEEILRGNITSYEVHSRKKRIVNKELLNKFRASKFGQHVLYCVNILNEGLHVKGVNAIFMMRRTKSPIIYLQQLGRLLSYSARDKIVYVFDTVDNIKNHPVIYNIYEELISRAKELINTDPDNKERYEMILNNLKIVDLGNDARSVLDELKRITGKKELIEDRLDIAVSILEGKCEGNPVEKLQAEIDIFRYKKYINIELFKRIQILDINKPDIFNLTLEEYEYYLNNLDDLKMNDKLSSKKDTQINHQFIFSNAFTDIMKELQHLYNNNSEESVIKFLFEELYEFIKVKYRKPMFSKKGYCDCREMRLFYIYTIFENKLKEYGYLDIINEFLSSVKIKNKDEILRKILVFINNNNGRMPEKNIKNEEELELAFSFDSIKNILSSEELELIEKAINSFDKNNNRQYIVDIINNYISFIKENNRYPLVTSLDEYEKELAKKFAYIEPLLTKEEKITIKNTFTKRGKTKILMNTFNEYRNNRRK